MTETKAPPRAQRLPPGRHGLSREQVRENQRRRLLNAATEMLAAHGYGAITVSGVASAAGVSTATLYKRFDGIWDCLLAAYEAGVDRFCEEIELAYAAAPREERAAAAIARSLSLLAAEPTLANLLLTSPPTHAVALGAARLQLAERLAVLLRATRPGAEEGSGRELPLIAGAMALVSMRLRSGASLSDLGPTLIDVLLLPQAETVPA